MKAKIRGAKGLGTALKYKFEGISVAAGITIIIINFLYISPTLPLLSPFLNIIGGLIAVVPPLLLLYSRYGMAKEIEEQFIVFIADLTEAMESGMTLPMALKYCSKRDYKSLTPYIRSMASQVDWGIPFRKALHIFAGKIDSLPVKRAITTIIETYKVGGKITDTLNAVGKSLIEISKIKSERSASVHAQIMTSYLIYFVFIFILVVLQTFLIPALSPGEIAGISATPIGAMPSGDIYSQSFINFIIIQGFFAGLATGKMAEGSVIAGLKHSVILIAVGYTIFSIALQFQFSFF